MDLVLEILRVLNGQDDAITMRHISFHCGIASSTIVGVMMSMLGQGYVFEVFANPKNGAGALSRCKCPCCTRKLGKEGITSLDRRLFRITAKGEQYIKTWSEK